MKNLIYLASFVLILSSCGSSLNTTGKSVVPGVPIVNVSELQAKTIVDKSKVLSGFSKTTVYFGIFRVGDNKFLDADIPGPAGARTKKAAVFNALEGTGYDMIVNPKYIVQRKKNLFVKTISCQVSGYGGKLEILD